MLLTSQKKRNLFLTFRNKNEGKEENTGKEKASQLVHTYIGQGGMCKHRESFKDILMIIVFYNSWPVSLKANRNTKCELKNMICMYRSPSVHKGTKGEMYGLHRQREHFSKQPGRTLY